MPLLEKQGRFIYWRIDGDPAKPNLVLLNSLGTDHALWEPVMPELLAGFQVLRMDKRGHGGSTNLTDQCSLADLADDVLSDMDAVNWLKASVCGISIGGMTAMWLGIHAPDRIERLVLSNTSARLSAETFAARIAQVRHDGLPAMADQILGRFFTKPFIDLGSPAYHSVRQAILQTDPLGYIACCTAIRDMNLQNQLGAIKAPCLIIISEADQSTPPEMGEDIALQIKHSKVVRMPLGHIPITENPLGYVRFVKEFLLG